MRIAGPALHVSLLLASGSFASIAFVGCAADGHQESTSSSEAPQASAAEANRGETAANAALTSSEPVLERAGANFSSQDDQLGQDASQLTLKEQKAQVLFETAIARAEEFKGSLELEKALDQADAALAIRPDDVNARRLRAEIGALLNRPEDSRVIQGAAGADLMRVKLDQIKLGVKQDLNDAKLALARGDYSSAIGDLSIARTNIEVNGFDIQWDGVDEEVRTLLNQAKADRAAAETAARDEKRRMAFDALSEVASAEATRQNAIVNNLLVEATSAFEFGDYRLAEDLSRKVQRRDPGNEKADEIRTAAFRAGRQQVQEDYLETKNEQFKLWREDLERQLVPYTDIITLADREEWAENTAKRKGRLFSASGTVSPIEAELREKVSKQTFLLPKIEEEESLSTVIDYVRNFTDLPFITDPAAETYVIEESGASFNFDFENPLTVEQALNRIVAVAGGEDKEITWTVRFDAIYVTTKEKALGQPVTRVHDVKDLIFALTDFIGPRINRIRLLDELEDEDGGGPYGTVSPESRVLIEIEDLANLIRDTIAPSSWDREGVQIDPGEGNLIIRQTAEIQEEIQAFLEDLRQFNSALVLIESKFLSVTDNFIQEIGNDFRGLDNRVLEDVTNGLEDMASLGLDNGGSGTNGTNAAGAPSGGFFFDDGLDGAFGATTQNVFETGLGSALSTIGGLSFQLTFLDDAEVSSILRAVEKSEQSQVVQSQMLSVHDSQRAYVTVINQRAYIQDFDVEVAQFQAVADPTVNVLSEGIVLDVRPTILDNRKWLRLEIQPTVARIVSLRSFSTTLGGNTAPVEFQLPELEVQSVNTSAFLPDGGSLLLGGLSRIRNIERRAEVPWIGRIPLLGFLFKSEGYNDERESLMIVVKATITDGREQVRNELESGY